MICPKCQQDSGMQVHDRLTEEGIRTFIECPDCGYEEVTP